ncbi:MAG: hypothetical protein HY862_16445 [Chloroflexi bacterium]|nr:hypothetical protein [Chloroflexota bacterium]
MVRVYTYRSKLDGVLRVNVECENCNHYYDYTRPLKVKHKQSLGARKPQGVYEQNLKAKHNKIIAEKYEKLVSRKHAKLDYGLKPCPSCGYTQSWMYRAAQRHQNLKCVLILLPLFILAFILVELIVLLPPYVNEGKTYAYLYPRTFAVLIIGFIITALIAKIGKSVFRINHGKPEPSRQIQPKITIEPSLAGGHAAAGYQVGEKSMLAESLAEFDKAIALDPQLSLAYLGRSSIHAHQGNFTQSLLDLREHVRLSGTEATPQTLNRLKELEARYPTPPTPSRFAAASPSESKFNIPILGWLVSAVWEFPRDIWAAFLSMMRLGPAAARTPIKILLAGVVALCLIPMLCAGMTTVPHAMRVAAIDGKVKPVCQATGNQSTTLQKLTEFGDVWVYGASDPAALGLDEASSVDKIDTLICVTEHEDLLETCTYSGDGKATLQRTQITWEVKVIVWDTQKLISKRNFTGPEPAECPDSLYVSSSSEEREYKGDHPDEQMVSEWLAGLVK